MCMGLGPSISSVIDRSLSYSGPSHHGLSQQGVWVPLWTPKPLKGTAQDTQRFLCGISENLNLKLIIEFYMFMVEI